jgi:hypothetical protein
MNAARDNARLADVYSQISTYPGTTVGMIEDRLGASCAGHWAVEQLLSRGMIVRLANVPGVNSVESRYATVRAAKSM